ncbi:MAG: putative O-glycosylation ligase, exosortase A system-associated [Azoarcus sp.]|jgi:probable O-glycosylation ligase (exosortase A-associated)|nr:putative O-glycosylation ligase, exosortase A system-associated [Azoarcus sp.]
MRDLVLITIFAIVLPMAFKHTWISVNLWTWVSIMNPHQLTYGFTNGLPFAATAAFTALVSIVIDKKSIHFPRDIVVLLLFVFIGWMCLTTALGYYPMDGIVYLKRVLKIQLMTIVAMMAVRERKHIEWFIWVNAISIGFYGIKGGIFTILTAGGARVWGPPGGFIEGNNEIGLAMVMTIPLLNYLRLVSPSHRVRLGLLFSMLLTAVAALGTQSRGALLAISAMAFMMWLRSVRKILSLLVLVIVAVNMLAFMPESWTARMNTIQNYEQDDSAMGRINAWRMAFNLANDRFFGGGFEIITPELFQRYAPEPMDIHAAHSIYFQVLGEHGWVGLALFVGIGYLSFRSAGRTRRLALQYKNAEWLFHLSGMLQVSLVGFAVGGAFLSLAYFDLPYNIIVIVVAGSWWLREQRWKIEANGAFGSGLPVMRTTRQSVITTRKSV